jgi:putative ABC transport system permease protein
MPCLNRPVALVSTRVRDAPSDSNACTAPGGIQCPPLNGIVRYSAPAFFEAHFPLSIWRYRWHHFSKTVAPTLSTMIRNYLTIAFRNLRRNKVFSFINIFGLALGLACSMLILLWVQDELTWDRFHPNIDKLYRVFINRPGNDGIYTQDVVQLPLWEELKATPGIRYVSPTDNWGEKATLAYKDTRIEKLSNWAGEDFLKMFPFPFIEGSGEVLNDASSIVLTESTAKALFGDEKALGKVIRIDDKADLKVSAVIQDPPQNSTLQFEVLIPFKAIMAMEPQYKEALSYWDNSSYHMYIEVERHANVSQLQSRLRDVIKAHKSDTEEKLKLFPLHRSRLYSEFVNGESVGGAITYVRIFMITAILVLALACINFINLATARSEKRAKEVGIRKTVGSNRKQLVLQFLSETVLMAVLAFLLAIVLVESLLPFFNTLVDKELAIDYTDPVVWGMSIGFILLTGVASGSYPAFFLSSFRPIAVLKGKLGAGKQGALPRKVMVTTQFFFSIGLLISTVVIYSQINYIKNREIGFDMNNLVTVPATGTIEEKYEIIKSNLLQKSLAASVSIASSPVTAIHAWSMPEWQGQREDQQDFYAIVSIGHDYIKTVDVELLKGRTFDPAFNDSTSMILNQAAVNHMELEDPIGAIVNLHERQYTVVGVMDDILMESPFHPAAGTIFLFNSYRHDNVVIRLPGEVSVSQAMSGIEEVFKEHNPAFPFSFEFADERFHAKLANEELTGKLSNLFAILAIVISCLGLFGLSAFAAEQRTKEVGIRKVLGATLTGIVSLFSKDFSKLVVIAFLLAAPLTWWIMDQWLQQYTYRVDVEWWMLAATGALALLLTWAIVGLQAAKAAGVNPARSLRNE